jgi:TonB family protein
VDFIEQLEQGRYGSFELKKLVGPNLFKGLAVAIIIHVVAISAPYIISALKGEEDIPPPPVRVVDISQLTKLRSMDNTTSQVKIAMPKMAPPKAALPVAVPKEEVPQEQVLLPTQSDIKSSMASADTGLDIQPGEQIQIKEEASSEEIPAMGSFTAFEVPPQPLPDFSPQPSYPEMAKTAGVVGKVVIQVYVDKRGDVKKWQVVKEDPKGLGFGEEVTKIIPKWKFTPAIQQGNPVGVWVSVPFKFTFKK